MTTKTKQPPQESPNLSSEPVQPAVQVQAVPPVPAAPVPTVDEQLAALPRWEAAALKAQYRWPQGLRLSTEEFAQARQSMKETVIG